MRVIALVWLALAGIAGAEVFPRRGGGAVTGELVRLDHGALVIRTAAGFSTYRPGELARTWTDEQWQRLGLPRPPRPGTSFAETWHGVLRAESWAEAVTYLRADPRAAYVGGGLLALLGLWFCFQGGCIARAQGRVALLVLAGGMAMSALGPQLHRWLRGDGPEEFRLVCWLLAHWFLLLLLLESSTRRRWRQAPVVTTAHVLAGTTTIRMAMYGALLLAQGLWPMVVARLGLAEAEVKTSWIAVGVAALAAGAVGCVTQTLRRARRALAEGG